MIKHRFSVTVDLRSIKIWSKEFKSLTSLIRTGVINEHGFAATKWLTDTRFRNWSIAIRFKTAENRDEFYRVIELLLRPEIFKKIGMKYTRPIKSRFDPVKYLRAS